MGKIKRKNQHHSSADKLHVIDLYEQGNGSTTISRELQICRTVAKSWIRLYQSQGVAAFEKQPDKPLSNELKEQVVREILNNSLSYPAAALKYHISQSTAYQWVQLVKQEGFSSLNKPNEGVPHKIWQDQRRNSPKPIWRNRRKNSVIYAQRMLT